MSRRLSAVVARALRLPTVIGTVRQHPLDEADCAEVEARGRARRAARRQHTRAEEQQ